MMIRKGMVLGGVAALVMGALSAVPAQAADVVEALDLAGRTLSEASRAQGARSDRRVYAQMERAYYFLEGIWKDQLRARNAGTLGPIQMILQGTPRAQQMCPNNRNAFVQLWNMSPGYEVPASVSFIGMYLCPHGQRLSKEDLAQVLLHEAFHSVGWVNECDVTYLELATLKLAGKKAHRNAYVSQCGYDSMMEFVALRYDGEE